MSFSDNLYDMTVYKKSERTNIPVIRIKNFILGDWTQNEYIVFDIYHQQREGET